MSVFYDLNKTPRNILNQAIVRAIVSENNGALFDPSDLSTLYQDAAGTIPVTAVEQPVGLMLDKSRWLMLGPELVSGFSKSGDDGVNTVSLFSDGFSINQVNTNSVATAYIVGNFIAGRTYRILSDLNVTLGAFKVLNTAWNNNYATIFTTNSVYIRCTRSTTRIDIYRNAPGAAAMSMRNVSVKELYGYHATQLITASRPTLSARKNILLATEALATQSVTTLAAQYTLSFTGTGSVTLSGTATGTLTGTGTDRVSLTFTPTAGTLTLTVSGSVTKAQLELGAAAGQYQRVTTTTDYDTDERYFQKYLRFDGVDDYLNLPYMGLYGGGAASIVCARDAVSQATDTYVISERSTTDADPKYFPSRQLANAGNMDAYIADDNAAVVLDTVGSPFSGVANAVIRSIVDSGNNLKLFKNGVLAANDNYTRSGALTLNTTTIGASVSTTTSNYASMKLYGLIVTKSAITDSQRIACERYLGRKSGVQL